MRKWLGHLLWQWSMKVYPDSYELAVVGEHGETIATVLCYGQHCATWQAPYDIRVESEYE